MHANVRCLVMPVMRRAHEHLRGGSVVVPPPAFDDDLGFAVSPSRSSSRKRALGTRGHDSGRGSDRRALSVSSLSVRLEFECDQPGEQRRRIQLADNALQISQTTCERMDGHDITKPNRRKHNEAEIKEYT